MKVRPAGEYPLDVYFLMDFSASMRDDLTTVQRIANDICVLCVYHVCVMSVSCVYHVFIMCVVCVCVCVCVCTFVMCVPL